jgi:hypothetical protein
LIFPRYVIPVKGDQYVFIGMVETQKGDHLRVGKRNADATPVHEALETTPAKALDVVDRAWAVSELIDAALAADYASSNCAGTPS